MHLPGLAAVLAGEVVNTLSKLVHYQQRERGSGWVQRGVKRPKRRSSPKELLLCCPDGFLNPNEPRDMTHARLGPLLGSPSSYLLIPFLEDAP